MPSTFVETNPYAPRGCYIWTGLVFDTAFFNTHAVGAGSSDSQLLCAAVTTTGAPPRALRGRRGRRAAAYGVRHYASASSWGTHGVLCGARGQCVSRSCAARGLGCGCVAQRKAVHRDTACAGCVRKGYLMLRYS